MNSIHFTRLEKTKNLLNGVVSGIGGYGNCIGIPTLLGKLNLMKLCCENILVNAMALVTQKNKIFYSKAKGLNKSVVYVGSQKETYSRCLNGFS